MRTTGVDRSVVVPSPSCPTPLAEVLRPQQFAAPADDSPHVLLAPALIAFHMPAPDTGVGVFLKLMYPGGLKVGEPSPSCPNSADPQQYAVPDAKRPQVCAPPEEMDVHDCDPETRTGDRRWVVVASPSWPNRFEPQQYSAPLVTMAQL